MTKDPFAEREAQRYAEPIASREYILETVKAHQGPCTFETIAELLGLSTPVDIEALRRRLRAMVRDGQLILNRRQGYLPVNERDLVRGRVLAHPDGFGFLHPDSGGDDLFISPKHMRPLLHGDRAVMRIKGMDRRGRLEAALVEVLERANHQIVGRLFSEGEIGYVVADNKRINQDILIPAANRGEASDGLIVVAEIVEQPSMHQPPIGRIIEVLGEHMAPGMEIDVAINANNIPNEWPPEVEAEAQAYAGEVQEQDKAGRLDLRDKPLLTIDGEDARDFDDAVYCEKQGKGWVLYVAIADVAHYVQIDSALDLEAYNRGTSVYFPGRVVPMLPESLSNGLCSINPQVDRLCMVCIMEFDQSGKMQDYQFAEAVMCSHARLTYTEVAAMLVDKDIGLREKYQSVLPHLEVLYKLYKVLLKQRQKRGAIDLDTTETRIIFSDEQKIASIEPVMRNDAHRLIEECMISANIAAAQFLSQHKVVGLYRVHEPPSADKHEDLSSFLGELGLKFPRFEKANSKHYAELLKSIKDRPDYHLIQTVLLRSLLQAEYQPINNGHFGLALEEYAHFTSPIRRYPDLLVHRAIRHILRGGKADNYAYMFEHMKSMGEHSSMTERRADEASRDAVDWLKCEYMQDKVGDAFAGIVTSVTSFGLFVELEDIYVEGLVHVTSLSKDYYQFDPVSHRLVGERTGQVFQLGDSIHVKVARVSLDDRQIDFEPIISDKKPKRRRKRR